MSGLEASFSAPVNTYGINSHATSMEVFYLCIVPYVVKLLQLLGYQSYDFL